MSAVPGETPDLGCFDVFLGCVRNLHIGIFFQAPKVVHPYSLAIMLGEVGKPKRYMDPRREGLIHDPDTIRG